MPSHNKNEIDILCDKVFDNEEVGSSTKQGADSTFLSDVLMRIAACAGKDNVDYIRACAGSFMHEYAHITSSSLGADINSLSAPHIVPACLLYRNRSLLITDSLSVCAASAIMMSFIEKSPTAFHVTGNFMDLLDDAGFVRLNERDRWHLIPGGKYYVTRNDSSIIAFRMPAAEGFINYQIAAAHSDSPSFKVKENPELTPDKNYVSLNVEKYGGMLMAPWFDRPLSVAGRAIVREGAVLKPVLVNVDRDLCIIPNLAIHMNREANTGLNYNAQKDMIPLIGETESKGLFDSIIADSCQDRCLPL